MAFSLDSHTADVVLKASGSSYEEAVSESCKAFSSVMTDSVIAQKSVFSVELSAQSPELLFFEFLDLCVFHLDVNGFLPACFDGDCMVVEDQWVLTGVVYCDVLSNYSVRGGIKAPTMHQLSAIESSDTWSFSCTLDL